MSNLLQSDPRTAWAHHVYTETPHNPDISHAEASSILDILRDDEHAEVLLRWQEVGNRASGGRRINFNKDPHKLAVRTIDRYILLTDTGFWDFSAQHEPSVKITRDNPGLPTIEWYRTCRLGEGLASRKVLFYVPGQQIINYLDYGAGDSILRLPPQPGAPQMPDVASVSQGAHVRHREKQLLSGWESAEQVAEVHLQDLGFADVRQTGSGADGGIDIVGHTVSAQVKMTALPVGRPTIQQLVGATRHDRTPVCYSTAGYTTDAENFAYETGVALFQIRSDSRIVPKNGLARRLEHVSDESLESYHWRIAYQFMEEVLARVSPYRQFFKDTLAELDTETPDSVIRAYRYMRKALKYLDTLPYFQAPREMVVHFHHAEQLVAFWARYAGLGYPESIFESKRHISAADFY